MTKSAEKIPSSFSEEETRALAILADMVVPASAEFDVPGAADPAILDAILSDAVRHHARLSAALAALNAMAAEQGDGAFADLADAQRDSVVAAFRETREGDAQLIAALVTQCYYRDDRVMRSLGMDLRPPHPLGYTASQGDWSLLDPVRKRSPIFRQTR
jgi:Gluconate 2-dehydrogenase subunit 3